MIRVIRIAFDGSGGAFVWQVLNVKYRLKVDGVLEGQKFSLCSSVHLTENITVIDYLSSLQGFVQQSTAEATFRSSLKLVKVEVSHCGMCFTCVP